MSLSSLKPLVSSTHADICNQWVMIPHICFACTKPPSSTVFTKNTFQNGELFTLAFAWKARYGLWATYSGRNSVTISLNRQEQTCLQWTASGVEKWTYSSLSHDSIMTVSWLSHDCLMSVSWLSPDCLMTVSRLSSDCIVTVSWLSHDFLMTPSRHHGTPSQHYGRGGW